ncbi:acyl-CoA dehydrogenase family protein [Pseudonocardia spinosispora]|uniref:acyl-CoA dehydrogenase family protein n=1 Tax=Pseudonocardia spinosispora TaxID=103441 RepID=UPI00068665D2|nr:acyl-CoA dehydrogenase family protein [Pseudonocardia spinosispora]
MASRWEAILGERLDPHGRESAAAAASLVPLLAANAGSADTDRRIPEANLVALREAGLLRLAVPRALGGHGAGLRTMIAACAELGRGCASTAWVTAVHGAGSTLAGRLGDDARAQIWAGSPDVIISGALGVPRRARRVPGGVTVDGRWSWVSGIRHADWVGLDVQAEPAGGGTPQRAMAFTPVAAVTVEDTWDMAGMRGTGSDTVIAENLFVPDDLVLRTWSPPAERAKLRRYSNIRSKSTSRGRCSPPRPGGSSIPPGRRSQTRYRRRFHDAMKVLRDELALTLGPRTADWAVSCWFLQPS